MNNIYPLRQYRSHTPVQPACRNFWIGYLAVVALHVVWWLT
jgi:hypothetical protein